jgi:hypothetical protein
MLRTLPQSLGQETSGRLVLSRVAGKKREKGFKLGAPQKAQHRDKKV